jgi:hypothetical protein
MFMGTGHAGETSAIRTSMAADASARKGDSSPADEYVRIFNHRC